MHPVSVARCAICGTKRGDLDFIGPGGGISVVCLSRHCQAMARVAGGHLLQKFTNMEELVKYYGWIDKE